MEHQTEQQPTPNGPTSDNPNEAPDTPTNSQNDTTDQSTQGEKEVTEYQFPWEESPSVRFENIGGYSNVKQQLEDQVVAPARSDSGGFERFDIDPAKGILFHGPPGTGKTLFARALANELNRPFVELNQADLTHEYVNKSPQIVSRLFEEAQEVGGIVFIDEAEQLLGDRGDSMNSHSEDKKITNTFLSALTQENQDYIVILTTNMKESIDDAILRPGRIDNKFLIDLPDKDARKKIIKVNITDIPHKLTQEQAGSIADYTEGWSGADLENLIEQAKFKAANENAEHLSFTHVKDAYQDITD